MGLLMEGSFNHVEGVHEKFMLPDAFNCNGCPITTEVSLGPASAFIFTTVSNIVSKEGLGQPKVSLTLTIYFTFAMGFIETGSAIFLAFKKAAGNHA